MRKSRGSAALYAANACSCQARSAPAVPHGARPGNAGDRCDAAALVIGLPLNMDGSEGPSAQAARAFGRNFEPLSGRPCVFWDERLSTAAVLRSLIEQDVSRAKRAEVVDKMAAAFILQGALDRLRRLGPAV